MLYFEDLEPGAVYLGDRCQVDKAEMLEYARANDPLPMHLDEEAAIRNSFGGLVASGGFTLTLWLRSIIPIARRLALIGAVDWHITLPRPVRAGDTLQARFAIADRRPARKPDRGVVKTKQELLNQDGEPVFVCEAVLVVATKAGPDAPPS
jgi:acyl dehydratase